MSQNYGIDVLLFCVAALYDVFSFSNSANDHIIVSCLLKWYPSLGFIFHYFGRRVEPFFRAIMLE